MKIKPPSLLIFLVLTVHASFAQKSVGVTSPDNKIRFELKTGTQAPEYSVTFNNQVLIAHSPLSLELDDGLFSHNIKIKNPSFSAVADTYRLVVGKARYVTSKCNQAVIPLVEKNPPFRTINLTVRAFNDGIAFRYEFPKQGNRSELRLYNEGTTFNITGDPKVLALLIAASGFFCPQLWQGNTAGNLSCTYHLRRYFGYILQVMIRYIVYPFDPKSYLRHGFGPG